jgi:hypothetical protein
MNERAAMQTAFQTNTQVAAQMRMPSWRTTCLVASAVLLVHVWLLSSSSLWLTPSAEQTLQTKAFVTRQIQLPPAQNATASAKTKSNPTTQPQTKTDADTQANTTTPSDASTANTSDSALNNSVSSNLSSFGNQDLLTHALQAMVSLLARPAPSKFLLLYF